MIEEMERERKGRTCGRERESGKQREIERERERSKKQVLGNQRATER